MPPPHRKSVERHEQPGHARFLTFSTHQRLPLFNDDPIKHAFLDRLAATQEHVPFNLFAYVIMPEHVHLLIQPQDATVSRILHTLKRTTAEAALRIWRNQNSPTLSSLTTPSGQTRFWLPGGGYDRNIFTTHELLEKINYIHNNPVARHLVPRPTDWPWSSARWYDGDHSGPVTIDPLPRH